MATALLLFVLCAGPTHALTIDEDRKSEAKRS